MPVYELIAGQHVHGTDAEGNKRVFRASHFPRLEPGGPVPGAGEPDPLFKEGDNFVKTNRTFRVVTKGKVEQLTLDQVHRGKFRCVDPSPVPEGEEMLFSLVTATCNSCGPRHFFKVHDRLAGKQVACPQCKAAVTVPALRNRSAYVNQELNQAPAGAPKAQADEGSQQGKQQPPPQQNKQRENAGVR